jgi:hypothetical protein
MKVLLAAFVASLLPGVAQAATIDFLGLGNAEIVTLAGIRSVSAWAGELEWAWKDGIPAGGTADPFYSYCVDLLNDERDPQYNVNVRSTDSLATDGMTTSAYAAQKAVWLFNTYAVAAHQSSSGSLAAGLQLAIWDVLYDDGRRLEFDGTLGSVSNRFYVTAASTAAKSAGQGYLDALNAPGTNYIGATAATWLDVRSGYGQDQITKTVPEPGTLLLLAMGFAGFSVRRRKASQA